MGGWLCVCVAVVVVVARARAAAVVGVVVVVVAAAAARGILDLTPDQEALAASFVSPSTTRGFRRAGRCCSAPVPSAQPKGAAATVHPSPAAAPGSPAAPAAERKEARAVAHVATQVAVWVADFHVVPVHVLAAGRAEVVGAAAGPIQGCSLGRGPAWSIGGKKTN